MAIFLLLAALQGQAGPRWGESLDQAKAEAAKTGKAIIALFLVNGKGEKFNKVLTAKLVDRANDPEIKPRYDEFIWVRITDPKVAKLYDDATVGNYMIFDPGLNKLAYGGVWKILLEKFDATSYKEAEPKWLDRAAAESAAKEPRKPMILVLYEDDAALGKMSKLLSNPWIAQLHDKFVWCKEVSDKNSEAQKSLKLQSMPGAAVLDPGRPDPLVRIDKSSTLADLRKTLEKALKSFESPAK